MDGSKIQELSVNIVTFGGLANGFLGTLIATLVAFPLVYLFQLISCFHVKSSIILFCTIVVASLITLHIALKSSLLTNRSAVVLDKTIGVLIAFFLIDAWFKLFIFGLFLYYLFLFIKKYLVLYDQTPFYKTLPEAIQLCSDDFIVGFVVNIILNMAIWVVR